MPRPQMANLQEPPKKRLWAGHPITDKWPGPYTIITVADRRADSVRGMGVNG
jgi:hypothetical protein